MSLPRPRQAGTLRTPDGETLALHDWPLDAGPAKAVVVLVHGIGEHAQRYRHVAVRLNACGGARLARLLADEGAVVQAAAAGRCRPS